MEIQLTLDGRKRKEAADCVGNAISIAPVYQRSGHAYDIGDITLDQHGVLTIGDSDEALPKVLDALQKEGFYTPEETEALPIPAEEPLPEEADTPEETELNPALADIPSEAEEAPPPEPAEEAPPESEQSTPAEDTPPDEAEALPQFMGETKAEPAEDPPSEPVEETLPEFGERERLVIQMPLDGFPPEKIDNLCRLVASKESLIKKAIGIDAIPITMGTETLDFPWVPEGARPEETMAYATLVSKLCDMAKTQQRVLAVEHPVENEKYAFRCFLLRLGFIGEEYAETRRILLRNLEGNGSHKSGDGKPRPPKAPPAAPAAASVAVVTRQENPPAQEAAPKSTFKKLFSGLKMLLA